MRIQGEMNNSTIRTPNSELPAGWRWVRLGEVWEILDWEIERSDD